MTILEETFRQLLQQYTSDQAVINHNWNELVTHYSHKKRYYHTLTHLENLLAELTAVKPKINDWNTLLFSLFYHDAIYNASKNDNEEKSAELAVERLTQLGVDANLVARCEKQILATKSHQVQDDADTNLFTDADLSVLGKDWTTYETYSRDVRNEYSIYPDLLYKPGRRKVLQHFLEMQRIFKTGFFFNAYENQARANMQRELELLH